MKKVSFSIGGLQLKYGDERALEIAKELGADAVDFATEESIADYRRPDSVFHRSDEEIEEYYSKLYEKAKAIGLEIAQTHGRLTTFYANPEKDAAALENARRDCLAAHALHAPYCVMHSVSTNEVGVDADPEYVRKACFDAFDQILVYARKYDVKVATETFGNSGRYGGCEFFGYADEFVSIYERICAKGNNKENFTICVDTGHSNIASSTMGNPTVPELIHRLGKNISCLHMHDNNALADQHKLPMTGTLDWNAVFDALDAVGYTGVYSVKIHTNQIKTACRSPQSGNRGTCQ